MDLAAISFPVLLVADDGWVQHIESARILAEMTHLAIATYNKSRVLILDHCDCVWEVENIALTTQPNSLGRLFQRVFNSRLPVQIEVRQITDHPIQQVQEVLRTAIEADDDILAGDVEPGDLKVAIQKANSYNALVDALRSRDAI